MKLVYLESAQKDLFWVRRYYESVFPEGRQRAQQQFKKIEVLLAENPFVGHKTHREQVRELSIPKTPFSYIYRVREHQIEVLRIWDERQERSA